MTSRKLPARFPEFSPSLRAFVKMQREAGEAAPPRRVYRYREKRAQLLLDAQKELYADAQSCLRMLGLMEELRAYGRPHLVGSVALKLVVRLDLDVHVLVPEDSLPEAAMEAAKTIFLGHELGVVNLMNFMTHDAMKVTVAYRGFAGIWNIDVWLTSNRREMGVSEGRKLKRELTDEHRKVILSLKHFYNQRNQCRYGLSRYLYRAVIEEGVRTPAQFLRYLQRTEVTYPVLKRMLEQDTVEQDPLWHYS